MRVICDSSKPLQKMQEPFAWRVGYSGEKLSRNSPGYGRTVVSLLLSGTCVRCREIRFIFSHPGGTLPMLAGRIAAAPGMDRQAQSTAPKRIEYEFRRLYYDTARAANRPVMAALTSLVPISQVLFGTDYPFVHSIARTLEGLKTVGFSEAELQAIERDNALALLPRFKAAVAAA